MYKELYTIEEQVINIGGERVYTGDNFDRRKPLEEGDIDLNFDWVETNYTVLIGKTILMDEVSWVEVERFFNTDEHKELGSLWMNTRNTVNRIIKKVFGGNVVLDDSFESFKSEVMDKALLEGCVREVELERLVYTIMLNKLKRP